MKTLQLLCACLVLTAPLCVPAQNPAGDRVAGRIVNALDDRPLAHATVSLTDLRSRRPILNATADDEGRFHFDSVAPGKYRMTGTASGYVPAAYMAHEQFSTAIVTGAGLATDALVLRLTPMSAISGRILDEAGEPVEHATVMLYRESPVGEPERIVRLRGANTGDTGEYEFDRLPPGRYFLSAMGTPWYAVHPRISDRNENFQYRQAIDPALDVAYPLTFFPHALDSAAASPITLHGGEQMSADMQLQPEHAVTLSIRAPSGENANQRSAQLTRTVFGISEPVQIQTSENNDGVQIFSGLAPGQYLVSENLPGSRIPGNTRPVDLTAGSISLDASPQPSLATVSVTVHAAGGETLPAHLQLNVLDPDNARVKTDAAIAENGTAGLANVPTGEYRFALNGGGHRWNVMTLATGGHPIADKRLRVTGSTSVSVDLTVSAAVVDVEGFARREGKPSPGSLVILVPAGSDTSETLFRRDQSDLDGSFTFANVVPGNYIVVAIDDGWPLHWTDTAALRPYLLRGLPITIAVNGSATFRLPDPIATQPR